MGYASYSACVAEVSVDGKMVHVKRLVFALNSGHVVNPYLTRGADRRFCSDGIRSYFRSRSSRGEWFALSSRYLDSYPMLKLSSTPRIETVLVPTYDFWGGVGEPTFALLVLQSQMRYLLLLAGRYAISLCTRKA
jgi:isoquinoline 1-oxidoreductase beta subunit